MRTNLCSARLADRSYFYSSIGFNCSYQRLTSTDVENSSTYQVNDIFLCYRGKFATVYQCEKHTTKELFAAKIIQTKSQKNMEESLNEVC